MQPVDTEVIGQVVTWLEANQRCWLATVVKTWGSSPRPVGSLLSCNGEGRIVGSLSGGCVEDDLLEKLTTGQLAKDAPQFFQYGVSAEESEKFGLPCGGSLYIVVEPLSRARHLAHFTHIVERLAERRCVERRVDLKSDAIAVTDVDAHRELRYDEDRETLTQTYGPRHQLFIIGAGMLSRYVSEMAQTLDYAVTVCDPRSELLDDFDVAGVTKVADMPDDAIRARAKDNASAIIALTHDPRIDDMGLMEALKTEAFYVGALGSTRTSAARRERLRTLDLSAEEISRLHAPIGLPIGSKTPPEIAIAILAEITAVRKSREQQSRERLAEVTAAA